MTEISEAAKEKACALMNEVREDNTRALWWAYQTAFARFIQEVSDAAKKAIEWGGADVDLRPVLAPFILAEPVDPLAPVLLSVGWAKPGYEEKVVDNFRRTLAKHGLKIVENKGD